ncbi:MAG: amidohydrolase family protein [Candidatus Dormibacteria bacterium]
MIVDSHVHILPDRVRANPALIAASEPWFGACHARGQPMASAQSLLAAMDAHGVDRSVCFTWPFADPALCAEANDHLAAVVAGAPHRLTGFGIVQPLHPEAAREVTRCARLGLRGIGEMNSDAQGWGLLDDVVEAPLRESVAAGMPWTLHCSEPVGRQYPGRGTATPDRVLAFADRHPELTLICAHLGGGLPLYAHIPEVRRACDRLHFDTAAQPLVYDASVYRALVDGVGAERILLGSDHPLVGVPRYLSALAEAGIDAPALELIQGGNAARLLAL